MKMCFDIMLMTLIETIQENTKRDQIKNIKTVKNAKIYSSNGILYCQHYDTIIFAHDPKNKICEIQKNVSMTSNRQIKFLIEAYGIDPKSVQNVSKFNKWEFRESL